MTTAPARRPALAVVKRRLPTELAEAVAAAGPAWSIQLGQGRFEELVAEVVADIAATPEQLTRGLVGYEQLAPADRPPRSEWLYSRNRRAFKAAAQGEQRKRASGQWSLDGGLS